MTWIAARTNYTRKRWLPDSDIEEIKELIIEGDLSDREIANRFGTSEGVVERIRQGKTYTQVGPALYDRYHRSRSKYSEDVVRRVHELALTGKYTHRQIGQMLGIPRPTVTSILNGESHRHLYHRYWGNRG